jgi:O-antigen/teichoic acid export membrane protein
MRAAPSSLPTDESPPESVRGLLRHSWIYSLAPVIQRLMAIVLIRFYTRKLDDPGEFGILEIADLLILLVPQLMGVNLLSGLTRFYFEHRDPRARAAVVTSTTIALTAAAALVTALLLSFRTPLAGALFAAPAGVPVPGGYVDAFTIAVLIVPFSLCSRSALQYLQVLKRSRASTWIQLTKAVFEAALKLWMLFGLEWGVFGFLLSVLIGEVVATVLLVGWMIWRLGARFDWQVFKPLLLFSLPMIPVGILQLLLHQSDRLLLQSLGPQELVGVGQDGSPLSLAQQWVGIYGLGYKLGQLLQAAVMASFMMIWQPHVFGLTGERRRQELERVGTWALAALAAIYLPAAVFGRQGIDLLAGSEAYRDAWRVVPWIVLAYTFYASYAMSQVALFAAKRTWPLLWLNLGAVLLMIGLNVWWIPRFEEQGYMAPTYATLVTFGAFALGGAVLAARAGWRSYRTGPVLRTFAIVALGAWAASRIDGWRDPLAHGNLLPVLGVKALVVSVLWSALLFLGLDQEARAGLRRLARDLLPGARGKDS